MSGRGLAISLVVLALLAGAGLYWAQVFAFYDRPDPASVRLEITRGAATEALPAESLSAIDAASSPIRFRACFTLPPGLGRDGDPYPDPTPLTAPRWFDCFDAGEVAAALEAGEAQAVMGTPNVSYGIDRVLALWPDGRGVAWHQINSCGREVFDGNPAPAGCPPPPAAAPASD